jgi:hypothetical protein
MEVMVKENDVGNDEEAVTDDEHKDHVLRGTL